jgi:hypothetical protein
MTTKKQPPLGIRNHNPGNIERGASWKGLAPVQKHPRFATFAAPEFGIRAIAITLLTYFRARKAADGSRIDTIREVVERWAPGFENNVDAYVAHVDELHPASADQAIDLSRYENLMPLVVGIIQHENGRGPLAQGRWYTQAQIDEGLRLAGVVKPAKVDPIEAGAATAAGGAGVAAAVEVASRAADVVDTVPLPLAPPDATPEVLDAVQQGLAPIAHLSIYVALVLAALSVGLIVYRIRRKRRRAHLEQA